MAEIKITLDSAKRAFNKIEVEISRVSLKIIDREFDFLTTDLKKLDDRLIQLEIDIAPLKRKEVVLKCITASRKRIINLIKKVYNFNPPQQHSDTESDQRIPFSEEINLSETKIS